nr:ubiquitin hydrolase [Tanacetum cinerariifolium]
MHKAFPLPVIKFPLAEEVSSASGEECHCQKKTSKDLDNLIESQRSDKNKEGLEYSVVPPPIAQIYSSPKKDLYWTGLPEFADDTVTNYSRPSPTVESTSGDDQNRNSSGFENGESTDSILFKPAVKFVKAAERGNQQNWNNLKSQQLGENFLRQNRACFNCGRFDHLSYNCGLGVKIGRSSPKNNYTHRKSPKAEEGVKSKNSYSQDTAPSLGEDCWELNVQGIPTASEAFSYC